MEALEDLENGARAQARRVGRPVALLRMVLILLAVVLFIYFLWRGGILALLAWLTTVIVLVDNSVNVLFAMYSERGSRRLGFLYWLASIFLGAQGTQVVTRKGEIIPFRPAGPLAKIFSRLGGPGILVIENGVAVVLERGGKFTRVHGPGIAWTKRFERIARVVDLRRQVRSTKITRIMTRDGLSFDLERLDVLFELESDFDPQRGEYAFSEQSVLNLVFRGGILHQEGGEDVEWGRRVVGIVEYHLRNVAAGYDLRQLIQDQAANPRTRFMEDVEKAARPALLEFGVRLIGIDMGQIVIPEEMRDIMRLPLRKDKILGIAEGLRQAIDEINKALKDGQMGELRPHLLLSLTDTLGRILEESLRLAEPYREGPAGGLLPAGTELPRPEAERK